MAATERAGFGKLGDAAASPDIVQPVLAEYHEALCRHVTADLEPAVVSA